MSHAEVADELLWYPWVGRSLKWIIIWVAVTVVVAAAAAALEPQASKAREGSQVVLCLCSHPSLFPYCLRSMKPWKQKEMRK